MPDRQQDLLAGAGTGDKAIKFVFRPAATKEGLGKYHDAKTAASKALVDLAPETVADAQLELVIPDCKTSLFQSGGERPDNVTFVLGRVRNKHIKSTSVWGFCCRDQIFVGISNQ
ncbi:hypothetical protein Maq22A_2p42515 (plasmid) [Methylobacterium aquaticum]|uniref:Uncharacterized protein n=1 Tax=Methylobacterium aquaticum TaxID=270351 RepID=A0A0C6FXF9_9HYPH|nr:hypothetical protein Maq22A_2p42515 [Methylobacterium aquaticum]